MPSAKWQPFCLGLNELIKFMCWCRIVGKETFIRSFVITSWYENAFCIAGPLWGESTDNQSQRVNNEELLRYLCWFSLFNKHSSHRCFQTTWSSCAVIVISDSEETDKKAGRQTLPAHVPFVLPESSRTKPMEYLTAQNKGCTCNVGNGWRPFVTWLYNETPCSLPVKGHIIFICWEQLQWRTWSPP